MADFSDQISEYRKSLLTLEQQMQSEYDKAIMALSGGALGVSMTFLKDVVITQGIHGGCYLLAAWLCWGFSVTSTLASFYTSSLALRKAVKQTDDRTIYLELLGGRYNRATKVLNAAAGLLFFAGVVSIVVFVAKNIP
jgi:hypothetical protein